VRRVRHALVFWNIVVANSMSRSRRIACSALGEPLLTIVTFLPLAMEMADASFVLVCHQQSELANM
jgi:hypothetical protein